MGKGARGARALLRARIFQRVFWNFARRFLQNCFFDVFLRCGLAIFPEKTEEARAHRSQNLQNRSEVVHAVRTEIAISGTESVNGLRQGGGVNLAKGIIVSNFFYPLCIVTVNNCVDTEFPSSDSQICGRKWDLWYSKGHCRLKIKFIPAVQSYFFFYEKK